jgi:hypothetical protein
MKKKQGKSSEHVVVEKVSSQQPHPNHQVGGDIGISMGGDYDEENGSTGGGGGSISNESNVDAPEILLSLSKSFDRLENNSSRRRCGGGVVVGGGGPTIPFTATFGGDEEVREQQHYHYEYLGQQQHQPQQEDESSQLRPTSPRGPPRIQHWHKQSMSVGGGGSDCSSFEVRCLCIHAILVSLYKAGTFEPSLSSYFVFSLSLSLSVCFCRLLSP